MAKKNVKYYVSMNSNLLSHDLNVIRNLYVQSGLHREKTGIFLEYMEKIGGDLTPLLIGYHGAALAMQADIVIGNFNKFNTFSSGREKLELAILQDEKDIEIRFLRFMVQSKIPKFINYNNLTEDKKIIFKNLSEIPKINHHVFVTSVFECLLQSQQFTETEKTIIKVYMNMPKMQ